MVSVNFKYNAFVSYRRVDGAQPARVLRSRLRRFDLPRKLRTESSRKRLEIYLDTIYEQAEEDFFQNTIIPALTNSEHLIVVQTPGARVSSRTDTKTWMEREIEFFKGLPQGKNISIAIAKGAFDASLPGGLHVTFPNIERVDIQRLGSWLSPFDDTSIIPFVAKLRRIQQDQMPILRREELRRKVMRGISAGGLALAIVCVGYLYRNQQLTARSLELAASAQQTLSKDQPMALSLAVRALETAKTSEAKLAIAQVFPGLITTMTGHTGAIKDAVFSPDGRSIATVGDDKFVRIWSPESGKESAALKHNDAIEHVAFSRDSRHVVTASADSLARVWSVAGDLLCEFKGHSKGVEYAVFSSDGLRILTSSGDSTAKLWRTNDCTSEVTLQGHGKLVGYAAFSPKGHRVVTASDDGTAIVWNAMNGQPLKTLRHDKAVYHATFSPDGERILTASADKSAKVWDAESGELLANLPAHNATVWEGSFSPDGEHIVLAGADGTASVWTKSGQLLARLDQPVEGSNSQWHRASFSSDGRWIVTADAVGGAKVWNAANFEVTAILPNDSKPLKQATFSPSGILILTGGSSGVARVWSMATTQHLATLQDDVLSAEFGANGRMIATIGGDGTAKLWNSRDGRKVITLPGSSGSLTRAQFSPDGQQVLTSGAEGSELWDSDGSFRAKFDVKTDRSEFSPDSRRILTVEGIPTIVRNAATGSPMFRLEGRHTKAVEQAVFSPNGRLIATASRDAKVVIWDAVTGQPLRELMHDHRLRFEAFSPDGERIATGQNGTTAIVWNVMNGSVVFRLADHKFGVGRIAYSTDGSRIVTVDNSTALLWNALDGTLLATLTASEGGGIVNATFSSDGQRLLLAVRNGIVRLFDTTTAQRISVLPGHGGDLLNALLAPDGVHMVTVNVDHRATLYRLMTLSDVARLLER